MPKQAQFDLLSPEKIWLESLLTKVNGLIDVQVFRHLEACGQTQIFRTCTSCGDWTSFWSHCNLKFCPVFNWRIARRRAELLRAWSLTITQPKHVVLTTKNHRVLTKREVRLFQSAFGRLRRSKFFAAVKGGCVSIEITNEGSGWHVHGHILCDVRYLDVKELAIRWGKLVGQSFGVVYVKDCRGSSYLHEVAKYCVKPAQMVSWHPEEIAQFIRTVSGCRLFATFGSLFKLRSVITAQLAQDKPEPQPCQCGCEDFAWSSEEAEVVRECRAREK
jgi:hypothetical protein